MKSENEGVSDFDKGRSPHGERGLKSRAHGRYHRGFSGRSPHGERGLKSCRSASLQRNSRSLSSWRAWIEMTICTKTDNKERSLSSWRAWIEIVGMKCWKPRTPSLSSWRAWIEITSCKQSESDASRRSPHGERGLKYMFPPFDGFMRKSLSSWRAWIEISGQGIRNRGLQSLSSWRAWIEMRRQSLLSSGMTSLSSWRAWIEIVSGVVSGLSSFVALLMESVD